MPPASRCSARHFTSWREYPQSREPGSSLPGCARCGNAMWARLATYSAEEGGYAPAGRATAWRGRPGGARRPVRPTPTRAVVDWLPCRIPNPLTHRPVGRRGVLPLRVRRPGDADNVIPRYAGRPSGATWPTLKAYAGAVIPSSAPATHRCGHRRGGATLVAGSCRATYRALAKRQHHARCTSRPPPQRLTLRHALYRSGRRHRCS